MSTTECQTNQRPAPKALVTIVESWNGQQVTWTARHERKVIATVQQGPDHGMWDSEPLALAIGAHFGIPADRIQTYPHEKQGRFIRKNSDGARLVPRLAEVTLMDDPLATGPEGFFYVTVRNGHKTCALLGPHHTTPTTMPWPTSTAPTSTCARPSRAKGHGSGLTALPACL
jgi:hypothetical protein